MSSVGLDVKKHIVGNEEWGLSQFQIAALSEAVIDFNFVAHENVSNQGDKVNGKELPATNHWSVFLTTSAHSSVRVEVAPNDIGKPGMVIVDSKKYDVSTKITKKVTIKPLKHITVADVFELIIQKKRDYYVFAAVGEGCRFWLYTLAGDLAGAGLISKEGAHEVQTDLVKYWPYPTGTHPVDRPMAEGSFPKSGH